MKTLIAAFKLWLTPPVFENEAKTHQAGLLHVILWTLVCVPIPFLIYSFIATPEERLRALIQVVSGEAANIFLLILLRRGQVRLASILQVTFFWLFFTVTALTSSGVQGEAYMLGYGIVIAIAGLLLGGAGAAIFTSLSLAVGALMVFEQMRGGITNAFPSSPLTTWVISALIFPVGAILQNLAARTLQRTLARAQFSEERYRLISGVSSDYVFSTNLDDDGVMRLNWVAGAFEKMTGYTYEEYIASGGWHAHIHPDDLEKDAQDTQAIKDNRRVVTEIRTFKKNGELCWVRVYAQPVLDATQKRVTGIVGAVQDISEQKKAEADREALIRELEAKNTELERFTYTVSHDLKSPLVTITGFLGYIEKDIREGTYERVDASIMRINGAAQKMQELLNDLLELSRIGRMMNPPVDLPFGNVVRQALDLLHGSLQARNVKVEVEENLPIVRGDRVRLVEVVQNLVENSIKFMGDQPNSLIQIGADRSRPDEPVFFVRDNGQGFDPQFSERIFGLFNKLEPNTEGTGIGLTLIKRIVEFHGGRVWAESKPGEGATFYFTLPTLPQP